MIKKVVLAVLVCIFAFPFSVCADYYNACDVYKGFPPVPEISRFTIRVLMVQET